MGAPIVLLLVGCEPTKDAVHDDTVDTLTPWATIVGGSADFRVVRDLDGDGADELLVRDADERLRLVSASALRSGGEVSADAPLATLLGDVTLWSYGGAGDVDGDGLGDVMFAGGEGFDDGTPNRVGVFFGSTLAAGGDLASTAVDAEVPLGAADAEPALRAAGDVDGDGHAEVLLASPEEETGGYSAGAVRIWTGARLAAGATTAFGDADVTLVGEYGDRLGDAGASGDLDGDGRTDLVVSASYGWEARILLADTLLAGEPHVPDAVVTGAREAPDYAVADLDGDGAGELLLTLPNWTPPSEDRDTDLPGQEELAVGRVLVFRGAALHDGWVTTVDDAAAELWGDETAPLGAVRPLGDVDGDGRDDLAVSFGDAWAWYGGAAITGGVSLGPDDAAGVLPAGDPRPGDFDGDGRPELAVGVVPDEGAHRVELWDPWSP